MLCILWQDNQKYDLLHDIPGHFMKFFSSIISTNLNKCLITLGYWSCIYGFERDHLKTLQFSLPCNVYTDMV